MNLPSLPVVSAVLLASSLAFAGPAPLDLAMALDLARKGNPSVAVAAEDLASAKARLDAGRGALFPTATLSSDWSRTAPNAGDEGRFNPASRSAGDAVWRNSLGLRWTVFDGLRSWNGLRGLREREEARSAAVGAVLEGVEEQVVRQWSDLWLAQRRLDVLQETMETSRTRRDIARRRAEIGSLSGLESRQAELDLMSDSLALVQAELSRDESSRRLELTLGLPPEGSLRPVDSWEIPAVSSDAKAGEPAGLEVLRHEEAAARADRRLASGTWWPELSLYADYVHLGILADRSPPGSEWHQGMVYGAKASWTVFEGGRTSSRIREASSTERRIAVQRGAMERELDARLRAAREAVVASTRGRELALAMESQSEALVSASLARYRAGDLPGIELRRAQDTRARMRLQADAAKADLLRASLDLQRLLEGDAAR